MKLGKENHRWKGGIIKDSGYIYLYKPEHPFARGKYIAEHRLVVEEYNKFILLSCIHVHHINEVRDDNRIENLEYMCMRKHNSLHKIGSKSGVGLHHSEETKLKISKTKTGVKNPKISLILKGRKDSEKTRKNKSIARIGNKNPAYNKVWIYNLNLKEIKLVNKEELENYINNGWFKGRRNKNQL